MKSKLWQVGNLQVELEDGGLRYITYNGVEIIRGIYAAVRDRDWGTVAPRFSDVQTVENLDGISIYYTCEHVENDIDFVWNGSIRLTERSIRFDFDGLARSSFMKNRIGFCVLHPMELAGTRIDVQTLTKQIQGEFATAISPHPPFKEIQAMSYETDSGIYVEVRYDGDLFEMEDQRNWTDASYKTYCTPLELPFPVLVEAGQAIRQSIEITMKETEVFVQAVELDTSNWVTLHHTPICQLPGIGFTLSDAEPSSEEALLLQQLCPTHLRLVLDLTFHNWRQRLESAALLADSNHCGLELELIIASDTPVEMLEALEALASTVAGRGLPVLRILPFLNGTYISDQHTLHAMKQALRAFNLNIPVGGGTRTYYAEYNRATLPLLEMDFSAYSINPQVHAFDDRSLMETLRVQAVTAADALAKSGKPLYVGPITFMPTINPNATSNRGISLEDQEDDRQGLLFGAAWTLGSMAALCADHVKGLTYYYTSGPIGLVEGSKARPLYYVFKDVAEFRGATILSVSCDSSHACTALALKKGTRVRILLANTTGERVEVSLSPGLYVSASIRAYNDESMTAMTTTAKNSEDIKLAFVPYGYTCIDLELDHPNPI